MKYCNHVLKKGVYDPTNNADYFCSELYLNCFILFLKQRFMCFFAFRCYAHPKFYKHSGINLVIQDIKVHK